MPDQHKPGPATNALIAEKVGWTAYREQRGDYELAVAVRPNGRPPWEKYQYTYQEQERKRYTTITCSEAVALGFFGQAFPNFTTDIAAAWEVLGAVPPDDYDGFARALMSHLGVSFDVTAYHGVSDVLSALTPMAICEAALAAVESEASG